MADTLPPATLTQLRNIQTRTGQPIAALQAEAVAHGGSKHGERRSWLMEHFKLGYGDANTVVVLIDKPMPGLDGAPVAAAAVPAGDPLDTIYAGAKAPLRPLHDAVLALVRGFGEFEQAPKKGYVSLRRKKQFATVGPATKDLIEIGFNQRALPAHARLKVVPPGGMCSHTLRLGSAAEVDADLAVWLRAAYDGAG